MQSLSISQAWEETKAILARDGRLFVSVAACLVAFPTLVASLLNPKGVIGSSAPLWISVVGLIASLIALAGQLSLVRLALGPSITVGAAVAHGLRRLPVYFLAVLIIVVVLFLLAMPFAVALQAMGVPLGVRSAEQSMSGPLLIAALLYLALLCFVGVRMSMSAPVASAERGGPLRIIKRSWQLTSGHFWRLFGFILVFFIGALVLMVGVEAAVGVVVGLLIGPIQPMSASAIILALVHALLNAAVTVLLAVMTARIYTQLAGRAEAEASVPSTGI